MGGDGPFVPKRICKGAATIPVELVGDRFQKAGSPRNRAVHNFVNVVDVEADKHRRAANRLRAVYIPVGRFISQHNSGIADLDLGVANPAIWTGQSHELGGAK